MDLRDTDLDNKRTRGTTMILYTPSCVFTAEVCYRPSTGFGSTGTIGTCHKSADLEDEQSVSCAEQRQVRSKGVVVALNDLLREALEECVNASAFLGTNQIREATGRERGCTYVKNQ